MDFDLTNDTQRGSFMVFVSEVMKDSAFVSLDRIKKVRTIKQNASLHKLFNHISDELINIGQTFNFTGLKGMNIEVPFTPGIVKECVWKPLELVILEKSSTTELTNSDIQLIFDVLCKWFAEQGVIIVWPADTENYHNYLKSKK